MVKDDRNFVYRHDKDYDIRYTDVDVKDNIKLSSLLSVMEESACLSADELGFGYSALKNSNYGFILVNWYVKLNRMITLEDKLRILTWPIKPQRLQVYRDFELYCGDEKVGTAISRWCIVDLNDFSFKPTSVIYDFVSIKYNDFRCQEFKDWKLLECEGELACSHEITYSDYDHYNHVNNTKYADFIMDAFGVEFMKKHEICSAQITYVKQCKEGEKLDMYKLYDGEYYHVDGRVGGESRVRCRLKFNEV